MLQQLFRPYQLPVLAIGATATALATRVWLGSEEALADLRANDPVGGFLARWGIALLPALIAIGLHGLMERIAGPSKATAARGHGRSLFLAYLGLYAIWTAAWTAGFMWGRP